jgi:hypothetical protein
MDPNLRFEEIISRYMAGKLGMTFRLESLDKDSSILSANLNPPYKLDPNKNYKVGLRYMAFFNQIVNLDTTNNVFRYSKDSGTTWISHIIPVGSWEISQLNTEIQRLMKIDGNYDSTKDLYYINLIPKPAINKIVIEITNTTYKFDRNVQNTITNC